MGLSSRLLTLRRSPILLKLPPYLSALCIAVGIAWLLLLPLNEYSRSTYISENAILPGQVHTYFGGGEHHIFRAYRQEVYHLSQRSDSERISGLSQILRENGLKTATQSYAWRVAGEVISGTNVYGLIQGPRADATEAMVLIAAWRNFEGQINYSGIALALTLARYFKRWSIWSKDIILLLPEDSTYGPEAWVSAYHSSPTPQSGRNTSALPIKAGALQAAIALDYPAGPWGQRFDRLDVLYDGINGALPNLDLLNTAVQVASSSMGISCTLHNAPSHSDTYTDRLTTLYKGILTQSIGHATGPHSAFIPYHVDAITLKTVGEGWHDEITLGRATESVVRSLNNLLEHLHQSFFFYLLLGTGRFVSIGNYLPAAMVVAGGFTIKALALWVRGGKKELPEDGEDGKSVGKEKEVLEVVKEGEEVVFVAKDELEAVERKTFLPAVFVLGVHLAGFVPLYLLNHVDRPYLPYTLAIITATSVALAPYLAATLSTRTTPQQTLLTQASSLLLLGAIYSTLATLNFSLSLVLGLLSAPLSFIQPLPRFPPKMKTVDDGQVFVFTLARCLPRVALWVLTSPMVVVYAVCLHFEKEVGWVLGEMATGWGAQGVWLGMVIWGVWWPAWVVGGVVLWSGVFRRE